jgi:hypothetical protein
MRRVALAVVVALLAVAGAAPALARQVTDPTDSLGPLDVIRLRSTYDSGTGVLTLVAETKSGWGCRYLRAGLDTSLNWYLDDGEDGDNDLTGKLVCVNAAHDPTLVLKLHGNETSNDYESLKAKRPTHHRVLVRVPTDLAELTADHLAVHLRSRDGIHERCDPSCKDRAPDAGGMRVY